ncbi:hypothetical protein DNTS_007811 [Danionella cerebrum]|uniref:FH2 domain-containing protein n=1 Tax=Danionella cerebrum TaxID=2873325 RepID=A0A553N5N3_9TELE|nr:hypothetical protein DNTS_007811 [Danionella translucida]
MKPAQSGVSSTYASSSKQCQSSPYEISVDCQSSESVLEALLHLSTGILSAESLRALIKLLPEEEEVRTLQMLNVTDLAPPDAFVHQLIHLPRAAELFRASQSSASGATGRKHHQCCKNTTCYFLSADCISEEMEPQMLGG